MISIVIPVLNGGAALDRCLAGIASQVVDEEVEVVILDSGSTDGSVDVARKAGAHVREISPAEFGHGRTRNLGASLARGDVLVFTSQDTVAADEHWVARLTVAVRSSADIAGAYGRQIPHDDALPPERFFLGFLYGPEPRTQRLQPGMDLTFEETLFSNANSAIRRAVWEEHPFSDEVRMSEDQEWSRRMLHLGSAIVYEPEAVVRHSHRYTIRSVFRRFFDSGVSAEHSFAETGGSRAAIRKSGRRYAVAELQWLRRTDRRRWIPYTVVYEAAKYAGLQLGLHHNRLPRWLERRLSGLPHGSPTS